MAPQASEGSGLHVIVWFKRHLHSFSSNEGHILLKPNALLSDAAPGFPAITLTDKAFESTSDENRVFYDQYGLVWPCVCMCVTGWREKRGRVKEELG